MSFWTALFLAVGFLLATIAIFATKFLFPHHRVVALTLYGIGWIPFLYSISLRKQWLLQHQETATSFLSAFWLHMAFAAVMCSTLYVFLVLFPVAKSPFIGMQDADIEQRLNEDESLINYLDQRLSSSLAEAEHQNLFSLDFNNVTGEDKESLSNFWVSYIEILIELDLLKERYKTFYQLNNVTKADLHKKAFSNGYTSFLAQHYYTLQLVEKVTDVNTASFLNEAIQEQGISKGTYTSIQEKLTNPDELLRLNTGRAYNSVLSKSDSAAEALTEKYITGVDDSIKSYANLLADKPLSFLERSSFKMWFPLQKQSAINISYVRTASREYHITPEQINQYTDTLKPGDILLERREWHATNVGIPGFWTHSALYIGSLEYLSAYFNDLPELDGKTFPDFLLENYPQAYTQMLTEDGDGYQFAVVESKRPGVVLMSLEGSTNADSLAVLRVKGINKSDHFKIVTQALSHLGKPYDYDFNFVTDNALVCSELVYKAFQDISQLHIDPQEINGRPIISPNQFAEKFTKESEANNSQTELILFLDGDEKKGAATEKGVDDFKTTWKRPKWHIANDFASFE